MRFWAELLSKRKSFCYFNCLSALSTHTVCPNFLLLADLAVGLNNAPFCVEVRMSGRL
jgi:hypothetical protein